MCPDKPSNPLEHSAGDFAHAGARALISLVPVVGGSAAELFSLLVAEPLSKRRDAWIVEIAERLKGLENAVQGFSVEGLAEDPGFTTVLLSATQIAIRTHRAEKHEALRNAVLNAALGDTPDDDLRAIFLGFVDRLTALHLTVLAAVQRPSENEMLVARFQNVSRGALLPVLTAAVPRLHSPPSLATTIWGDLRSALLVEAVDLNMMMTGSGLLQKRTTALGDQLLRFISEPA
ncbi:hypothetical protein STAQ_27990 [Allostella sp. ATCC 35155]|nr:hypothetical protein STAQ_27990 [Stella sp. ATCC 35155]